MKTNTTISLLESNEMSNLEINAYLNIHINI